MGDERIRAVFLDLGGVVYVGEKPIEGAIGAVGRLRDSGLAVRFLTNTSRRPKRALCEDLAAMGLDVDPAEVLTPASLAAARLTGRGEAPHLLVHPALEEDFAGCPSDGAPAVVVGDAADGFAYAPLNAAFRRIADGAAFYALGLNRTFRDTDGALSLDAGPFVKALEYASRREATVLGKPSRAFFEAALADARVAASEAVMVGDDVESDVGGAQEAGIAGVLVRTGKYGEGDEARIDPAPAHVAEDLATACDWILSRS